MVVVVSLAVRDVPGQGLRQLLTGIPVDQVDHVVAHQGREPSGPLATELPRADVGRRRRLYPDAARRPPGGRLRLTQLRDEPADQVGIGQLQDQAVGHPSGHGQRHRSIPGHPHRELPLPGPWEDELGALVGHRSPLDQVANDDDRLFQRLHGGRRLAEDPSSAVAAPDSQVHPAPAQLVEHRQRRCRHARLARGRVRDAGPEPEPLAGLGHQGEEDISLAPQDVAVEEPPVAEPVGFGSACQLPGALDVVLRLEGEPKVHRCYGRTRSA